MSITNNVVVWHHSHITYQATNECVAGHPRKLRARDVSKFHVQLSLSLLCMLLVFVVGIDRTEVFEGCVTVSVLIHYFTLVTIMWMGAEALLMFQKLVIVFVQITTRYIVIVSLVCWCKGIINLLLRLHAVN